MELEHVKEWDDLTGKQKYAVCVNVGGIDVIKGILWNKYKVVLKDGSDVIIRKLDKLKYKVTTSVSALDIDRDDLFAGKLGIEVSTYGIFDEVVKNHLPKRLVCLSHQRDVFTLTRNMWDSEMQNELGQKEYPTVEDASISLISRALMHVLGEQGHELLTNRYANIEHARAGDGRIVAVNCSFEDSELKLSCSGLDEGGRWSGGQQFSSSALGA